MKSLTKFQIILLIVFGAFIVIGVLVFATASGGGGADKVTVEVWGPYPDGVFRSIEEGLNLDESETLAVSYRQYNQRTLEDAFITALADNRAPDLVIFPHEQILANQGRLAVVPDSFVSERIFKDSFVSGAEILSVPGGFLGLPVQVDPLVLYWNRTLFTNAGISAPPTTWTEVRGLLSRLTVADSAGGISRSAIALGEYQNITNAKEILATLVMQAGNPITTRSSTGEVSNVFRQQRGYPVTPALAALSFYTEFSDPIGASYTWNRALPSSQDLFLSGRLALYIGFASEARDLRQKNPNLDFDIALLPQSTGGDPAKIVFGRFMTAAVVRSSGVAGSAFQLASLLAGARAGQILVSQTLLPPVRRDLLAQSPGTAALSTFYTSALFARAWADKNPGGTEAVFARMIESVTSGRTRVSDAVSDADRSLDVLLE